MLKNKAILALLPGMFCTLILSAQDPTGRGETVPIYRVTVVDRTVSAVDYQYRNGPTEIDFRGTVLLPMAKGGAMVESKKGRIEIEAHFDRMEAPTRFGREYLTYVLWAITPDGHAKNLGEVLPGSSDKAKMRVTTDLQAFGLIITAEPYSAVRQPSDVVVLENVVRPDTIGRTEPIQAKYELLPRGHYTYNVPSAFAPADTAAVKLSSDEYQSVVELYQAQNAVQIAQAADASHYAPDTFAKAQDLLRQAQEAHERKGGMTVVVTLARQAAQTAEDSRTLTLQRKHDDDLARAREQAVQAEARRAQAEAAAQTAQTQAAAAQALLAQERSAREQAEAQAQAAATPPLPATPSPVPQAVSRDEQQKRALRLELLNQFGGVLAARDTPRGLMLTLPGTDFEAARLSPAVHDRLARIAAMLRAHPDLMVEVDGHESYSAERAEAVRDVLVSAGVPPRAIVARGLGDSRPLASNATTAGREQNRRVEIVISGAPIGDIPYWTKSYTLGPSR